VNEHQVDSGRPWPLGATSFTHREGCAGCTRLPNGSTVFGSTLGVPASSVNDPLVTELNALLAYAAGESTAKAVLTQRFVDDFASIARVGKAELTNHVNATIKVLDDQRSKSWTVVANDDRAAATSTLPIGDAIRG